MGIVFLTVSISDHFLRKGVQDNFNIFFVQFTEKNAQQPVFIKEEKEDPEYSNNASLPVDEQDDEPAPKRLARSASPPHVNGVCRSPSPRFHVHDNCRSYVDHMVKESERPTFQFPWNSTFRDQDDFDYTVKLLQKSLGESTLKRRKPPRPVEVLSKVFPSHKENVLELVLKGCSGDIVQAIECILAGKSHSIDFPEAVPSRLPSVTLSSCFPSMSFAGVKPSIFPTAPLTLPLTSHNAATTTAALPLTSMGGLSAQAHAELRSRPAHLRSLPIQNHRCENDDGERHEFNATSGLLRPAFLSTYSGSPPPSRESSFADNEVSACFRCGTKPRSGDRFCGKCGTDLKC